MTRYRGDTASPKCLLILSAVLSLLVVCGAGPLGPLPNVTISSSDLGLKDGGCAVGDVVYAAGEEFPGAGACERCACAAGVGVRCERVRCQPRAGCKALHRPDQCCPTYQCECEQEGRVYGNGEKLVDPLDPCRVCYCQGGEVVCRRIACFVRDDCRPRHVPGRCCPEYDNCPLRGVTTIPGSAPLMSSMSTVDDVASSPVPSAPKESIKQEITIKEITPVSEIPVITEVKIKEILPSPSIEIAEYSSSKSPLIVREATSEKTIAADSYSKTVTPTVINMQPSSPLILISSPPAEMPTKSSETSTVTKSTNDSPPSKISLSTQDSINSEIYPSILTSIPTMGFPSITPDLIPVASTTKAPVIEEEESSLFDHNPAFPPLPDDLSVPGNHEDEISPEQTIDGEHVSIGQEVVSVSSVSPSTEAVIMREPLTTTSKEIVDSTQQSIKFSEIPVDLSTVSEISTDKLDTPSSTEGFAKESPMLNLRSAIPTEILNAPSYVPEEINGELDDVAEMITVAEEHVPILTSTATESVIKSEMIYTEKIGMPTETEVYPSSSMTVINAETTTTKPIETTFYLSSSQNPQEQTTSSVLNSNIATEITSQTELSSLPVETSDQNPHEISENIAKEIAPSSTIDPSVAELPTTKMSSPIESEVITVSRSIPSNADNQSFENVETTEFIVTSFVGSSESATDAVELIKISADPEKIPAVIDPVERKKNNVLTDLINLVGDVASIGDHTDNPSTIRHVTGSTSISDSEELIPVNAGYKSKNNNWNINSITEIPVKSKNQLPVNKQKVVEIEGDDTDSITDSPPPYDKVEPTTRRPIIDNVSDDMPENKTGNKDIEIITKSYVPTINRRPTKVIMKKNNEKAITDEKITEGAQVSASSEVATESTIALSSESADMAEPAASSAEGGERTVETTVASSTVSQ